MSLTLVGVTLSIAMSATTPAIQDNNLAAQSKPLNCPIIVQQYGDNDPHGADPHGANPHDEIHDSGLKANAMDNDRAAPQDVYGGKLGANSQHPLDNVPPR
jgi:hypothetical protein